MPAVLHSVLAIATQSWRRPSSWGVFLSSARYREAVVCLKELDVEAKRHQLAKQRANDVIDIMLKVEKIKDPQLREKARTAILAGDRTLLPHGDAAA